jgi:hypothetical protein
MISAFSFANEKTTEIVLENNVQTVSVETQQRETLILNTEELLTYCWTTITYWATGNQVFSMAEGGWVDEYIVNSRTTCLTV